VPELDPLLGTSRLQAAFGGTNPQESVFPDKAQPPQPKKDRRALIQERQVKTAKTTAVNPTIVSDNACCQSMKPR